ncbi:MAG: hypothetical protein KatS3mg095_0905 [Candidatus Parcubacteria bacterium]|nr:MAG: hypothetical protein KatS3mg095_0905 [Candidatus Parcubacteria bacterium]
MKPIFSEKLITFSKAIKLFKDCIINKDNNYFNDLKKIKLEKGDDYKYYKYLEITPENCLEILNKVRNSYVHHPNPNNEKRAIPWYLYNFLLWLLKKEFREELVTKEGIIKAFYDKLNLRYIGDKEVLNCFPDNGNKAN